MSSKNDKPGVPGKEKRISKRKGSPKLDFANCKILDSSKGMKSIFAALNIKDISEEGIALRSKREILKGSLIFLNIDLEHVTIGVIGEVVRIAKQTNDYEIGVCFKRWPNKEDKKFLKEFIKEQEKTQF